MQIKNFQKTEYIVPTIYLLGIFFCLFFAVTMTTENSDWFFILMILTLPWSFITFFLVIGAIHNGGSNQAVVILVTLTSFMNASLFYIFARKPRIREEKVAANKLESKGKSSPN